MPTGKLWTMNCVLAGAKVQRMLDKGEEEAVRNYLRNLTSELEPQDVEYLIMRLKWEADSGNSLNHKGR